MEDVNRAYDAIMPLNAQLAILQCTASYPAEFNELNLRVITTFRDRFPNTIIGLSSHDNGIAMAVAAYMLGARIVEKHHPGRGELGRRRVRGVHRVEGPPPV